MAHKTTWEENGIHWEYFGVVTLQEVAQSNTEFYCDDRSDAAKYQIFDGIAVEEFVGTEEEARMIAAIDLGASRSITDLKVALIVPDSALDLAKQYIASSKELKSPWSFRIFPSVEEARKWVHEEIPPFEAGES